MTYRRTYSNCAVNLLEKQVKLEAQTKVASVASEVAGQIPAAEYVGSRRKDINFLKVVIIILCMLKCSALSLVAATAAFRFI